LARDEALDLLELAVRVAVGNGLEHLDVALFQLGLDGLEAGDPVLGLQSFEGDADGESLATACAGSGFSRLAAGQRQSGGERKEERTESFHGLGEGLAGLGGFGNRRDWWEEFMPPRSKGRADKTDG